LIVLGYPFEMAKHNRKELLRKQVEGKAGQ